MCCSTCSEIRGQFVGISSFLLPCGTWMSNSGYHVWLKEPLVIVFSGYFKILFSKSILFILYWHQCTFSDMDFNIIILSIYICFKILYAFYIVNSNFEHHGSSCQKINKTLSKYSIDSITAANLLNDRSFIDTKLLKSFIWSLFCIF